MALQGSISGLNFWSAAVPGNEAAATDPSSMTPSTLSCVRCRLLSSVSPDGLLSADVSTWSAAPPLLESNDASSTCMATTALPAGGDTEHRAGAGPQRLD